MAAHDRCLQIDTDSIWRLNQRKTALWGLFFIFSRVLEGISKNALQCYVVVHMVVASQASQTPPSEG